jgi:hypothetical protein
MAELPRETALKVYDVIVHIHADDVHFISFLARNKPQIIKMIGDKLRARAGVAVEWKPPVPILTPEQEAIFDRVYRGVSVKNYAQAKEVLELIGVRFLAEEKRPRKRSPSVLLLDFPGIGEVELDAGDRRRTGTLDEGDLLNPRSAMPERLTDYDALQKLLPPGVRLTSTDPEQEKIVRGLRRKLYAPWDRAREYILAEVAVSLGRPHPKDVALKPSRDRDYLTNLDLRTCAACFRDIMCSTHTHRLIADHGYTIAIGWREGSCYGSGKPPWERPEGRKIAEDYLERLETVWEPRLRTAWERLNDDDTAKLLVFEVQDRSQKRGVMKEVRFGEYEWDQARRTTLYKARKNLSEIWRPGYGSIPWYRAALRTWEEIPWGEPAIGAPDIPREDYTEADFAGMPGFVYEETVATWVFRRKNPRRKPSANKGKIQTLLLDKRAFSRTQAAKWAKRNGYKVNKIDTTDRYHRIRQAPPKNFQRSSFRTIQLTPEVKAVIALPKR